VTLEKLPPKLAAVDQPFSSFTSADAVTRTSLACAAPLSTKDALGKQHLSGKSRQACEPADIAAHTLQRYATGLAIGGVILTLSLYARLA
jgi:hypothetical protein